MKTMNTNVRIIKNPVVALNLCTMRDKNTDSQGVRIATRKITRCLLYEASKNLPLVKQDITIINAVDNYSEVVIDSFFSELIS